MNCQKKLKNFLKPDFYELSKKNFWGQKNHQWQKFLSIFFYYKFKAKKFFYFLIFMNCQKNFFINNLQLSKKIVRGTPLDFFKKWSFFDVFGGTPFFITPSICSTHKSDKIRDLQKKSFGVKPDFYEQPKFSFFRFSAINLQKIF